MAMSSKIPETLTDAEARSRYCVHVVGSYHTQSTSRSIPYAEVYRGRTSMMETPAQQLQKAAEEDKQRDDEEG